MDKTRKLLKKNNNIIIVNSDKGNVTVAMDKQDYTQKINSILKERSTYKVLKRDPTTTLQQKNNVLVENLFKEEVITLKEKNSLTQRVATAPRIYGLPKIYKDNMPLRPICYVRKFTVLLFMSICSQNIKYFDNGVKIQYQ